VKRLIKTQDGGSEAQQRPEPAGDDNGGVPAGLQHGPELHGPQHPGAGQHGDDPGTAANPSPGTPTRTTHAQWSPNATHAGSPSTGRPARRYARTTTDGHAASHGATVPSDLTKFHPRRSVRHLPPVRHLQPAGAAGAPARTVRHAGPWWPGTADNPLRSPSTAWQADANGIPAQWSHQTYSWTAATIHHHQLGTTSDGRAQWAVSGSNFHACSSDVGNAGHAWNALNNCRPKWAISSWHERK